MATKTIATKQCPRAVWRVIALSVVTLGFYPFLWMGLTWSEMKRELEDETMHPFWHALSLFVPIYGWFRFHDHFKRINQLAYKVESPAKVNPSGVVKALIVSWVVGNMAGAIAPGLAFLVNAVVLVGVAVHGQSAMNSYWTYRAAKEGSASMTAEAAVTGVGRAAATRPNEG